MYRISKKSFKKKSISLISSSEEESDLISRKKNDDYSIQASRTVSESDSKSCIFAVSCFSKNRKYRGGVAKSTLPLIQESIGIRGGGTWPGLKRLWFFFTKFHETSYLGVFQGAEFDGNIHFCQKKIKKFIFRNFCRFNKS